jgi:hypothetical protein
MLLALAADELASTFVVEHVNNKVHGDHIALPMQDSNMQLLSWERMYNRYVLDGIDLALCYKMGTIQKDLLFPRTT